MTYAKVDDIYDDKRKIKRAWRAHSPNPIGLHIMAITYCQRHALDGRVPDDWLEELLPKGRDREAILATMVREGLFDEAPHPDGRFAVHDFLEWNESAAERESRAERARRAANKRYGNANSSANGNA